MKVDTYYDITCCHCARSRSTDFEKGMYQSKKVLTACAKKEGWGEDGTSHMPICPDCKAALSERGEDT